MAWPVAELSRSREVQVTIDDRNKTFTKRFTIKFMQLLIPDSDILESFCNENEKDRTHLGCH